MIKKQQHTPGPWMADGKGLCAVRTKDYITICDVHYGTAPDGIAQRQANAYLIAAAPDLMQGGERLLGALGSIVNEMHNIANPVVGDCRSWALDIMREAEELKAAIARATEVA